MVARPKTVRKSIELDVLLGRREIYSTATKDVHVRVSTEVVQEGSGGILVVVRIEKRFDEVAFGGRGRELSSD